MGQGAAQAPSQGDQQAAASAAAAVVANGGSTPDVPAPVSATFNPMAWLAPGSGTAPPNIDSTDNT